MQIFQVCRQKNLLSMVKAARDKAGEPLYLLFLGYPLVPLYVPLYPRPSPLFVSYWTYDHLYPWACKAGHWQCQKSPRQRGRQLAGPVCQDVLAAIIQATFLKTVLLGSNAYREHELAFWLAKTMNRHFDWQRVWADILIGQEHEQAFCLAKSMNRHFDWQRVWPGVFIVYWLKPNWKNIFSAPTCPGKWEKWWMWRKTVTEQWGRLELPKPEFVVILGFDIFIVELVITGELMKWWWLTEEILKVIFNQGIHFQEVVIQY